MSLELLEKAGRSIAESGPKLISHALFLGGLGAVTYGAGLIFMPLHWVVGGGIAVWLSLLIEKESRESSS